jgi:hypothetical protein
MLRFRYKDQQFGDVWRINLYLLWDNTKHINILCEQSADFFNIEADDMTCNNQ